MQQEINIPIVLEAVRKVGIIFLKDYKKNPVPQSMEELLAKLDAIDEKCMTSLKSDLAVDFPNIPWLIGDEFDTDAQRKPAELEQYWLCDAMDGAIQYLQHISGWTINLVLIQNGKPRFSVIFDPLANELFWAKEGDGAFMNDTKLQPSHKSDFGAMLAVFEYGHQDKSNNSLNQKTGDTVRTLLENFGIVRNYGPHGLQLAYVAAGRIDLFVQQDLDTYNWLAGLLIAKEAGAEILTTNGQPWQWGNDSLLVAQKEAAQQYLKSIKK